MKTDQTPFSYVNDISKRDIRNNVVLASTIILQNVALPHIVHAATSIEELPKQLETVPSSSTVKTASALSDLSKPPYINGEKVFIDGVVSRFRGDISIVTSPIIDEKTKERTVIGKIAQLNKLDVVKVIDSSVRAWKGGQGEWPQMSPAERIFAIENVIKGLKEKRSEIIHVLMWEIGKTLRDATSEFGKLLSKIHLLYMYIINHMVFTTGFC